MSRWEIILFLTPELRLAPMCMPIRPSYYTSNSPHVLDHADNFWGEGTNSENMSYPFVVCAESVQTEKAATTMDKDNGFF